jgi:hypothetical protein
MAWGAGLFGACTRADLIHYAPCQWVQDTITMTRPNKGLKIGIGWENLGWTVLKSVCGLGFSQIIK